MINREKAEFLNEKAIKLQEEGKLDEAIPLYEEVIALHPTWAIPAYNLGLLYKKVQIGKSRSTATNVRRI